MQSTLQDLGRKTKTNGNYRFQRRNDDDTQNLSVNTTKTLMNELISRREYRNAYTLHTAVIVCNAILLSFCIHMDFELKLKLNY